MTDGNFNIVRLTFCMGLYGFVGAFAAVGREPDRVPEDLGRVAGWSRLMHRLIPTYG